MTERPKTYDYVAEDLGKVRDLISRSLHSDIELLNDTNSSILDHPGKMMRPVLALLAAKACSGGELSEDSYSYAAAAELLHNATLLHDDVADNSSSRRGRPTVMKLLGGNAAVLLGDYWLVRAMEKILSGKRRRDDAMSVFSKTLSDLAQGEMLQLQKSISGDLTEEEYFRVIYCKTASLFEASAVTGAYSVEAPEEYVEAVRAYAVNLGLAFQIKDDILHKLGEHIQAPEELAEAQKTLAEVAEHCGQTGLYEGMTRLDIRQLQMMTAQLHLGVSMTKEERYQIPILTGDGAMGINLRIIRGSEKKGSVRITMESAAYGKVAAELHAEEQGIRGYLASDSRTGADRLQREQSFMEELLGELTGDTAENEIRVIYSEHLDLVRIELSGGKSEQPQENAQREVQTKELYGIAEKLIQFFGEGITKEA